MSLDTCPECGFALQSNFRFCPGCGLDLRRFHKCSNCGRTNNPRFKFCPECSAPMRQPEGRTGTQPGVTPKVSRAAKTPPPLEKGITVEFPFSPSRTFDYALEEAKTHPSFVQIGQGTQALYRVTYDPQDLLPVLQLAQYLEAGGQRKVYVDGEDVPWDSVFRFAECFERRQRNYKPDLYCFGYEVEWQFNIWGCAQLELPFMERAEWFSWGRFVDRKGTWEFDKKGLRQELRERAYPYRFCPAIDTARMLQVLRAFPDRVNPTRDKGWQFEQACEGDAPGLVVVVPRRGQEPLRVKGVRPVGLDPLKEMERHLQFKFMTLAMGR